MERKLASIQKILNLEPIEGADKIEKATVLGWSVVVQKGLHKIGDLVCYLEIDSLIPRKPWNEFLYKPEDTKTEFRLRTIRLKKQISQGLIIPLKDIISDISLKLKNNVIDVGNSEIMKEIFNAIPENYTGLEEGDDVTELLGITKYEPPIPAQLAGTIKGLRPSFIPKTDETRIQSVPQVLNRYNGNCFYLSEKIDGSSMTVYVKDRDNFGVCSRNLDMKEDENNAFWKVAKQLELIEKIQATGRNYAIQGELYGEGVQNNKYKLKGLHFALFNVYDIDAGTYLSYESFINFANFLKIPIVPILSDFFPLIHSVDELVEISKGKSQLNKEVEREGIVLRPLTESRDEDLGRLSFKVINPLFLLKYEDS